MSTMNGTKELTSDKRIEMVRDAQDMMLEAYGKIATAVKGHPTEKNTRAYILDHLYILITEEHGFLSRDKNLDDVIRELDETRDGCTCGEMDFRWDEEDKCMRCWECGGINREAA